MTDSTEFRLMSAAIYAKKPISEDRADPRYASDPLVLKLSFDYNGVNIEARRLIAGDYAGAVDRQKSVAWSDIKRNNSNVIEAAIEECVTRLDFPDSPLAA